jgi:hypothetical protein
MTALERSLERLYRDYLAVGYAPVQALRLARNRLVQR